MVFELATQLKCESASRLSICAFNQKRPIVGAFSVIVKSSRTFASPSFQALIVRPSCRVMKVMASKLLLVLVLAWSMLNLSCALTYRDCFCGQKRQIHGLIEVNYSNNYLIYHIYLQTTRFFILL